MIRLKKSWLIISVLVGATVWLLTFSISKQPIVDLELEDKFAPGDWFFANGPIRAVKSIKPFTCKPSANSKR